MAGSEAAGFREGWWRRVRVRAMMYTQAARLHQHPVRFSRALMATGDLPIVEVSSRAPQKGSRPELGDGSLLRGANVTGKVLTELRDELRRQDGAAARAAVIFLEGADTVSLLIDGKALPGLLEAAGGPDSTHGTA